MWFGFDLSPTIFPSSSASPFPRRALVLSSLVDQKGKNNLNVSTKSPQVRKILLSGEPKAGEEEIKMFANSLWPAQCISIQIETERREQLKCGYGATENKSEDDNGMARAAHFAVALCARKAN